MIYRNTGKPSGWRELRIICPLCNKKSKGIGNYYGVEMCNKCKYKIKKFLNKCEKEMLIKNLKRKKHG